MDDRFKNLILQQIKDLVEQPPSVESLVNLLRFGIPSFTEADVSNDVHRGKAYRALQLLVHPDKHPFDKTITPLFQRLQTFYDESLQIAQQPKSKKRKQCPPVSSSTPNRFPLNFHVRDKWAHIDSVSYPAAPISVDDIALISSSIAYKCINFRGAIAHGKKTEKRFSYKQILRGKITPFNSVEGVFGSRGGSKEIDTVEAIQQELMEHGPVVSASFILTQAFLNVCEHSGSFAPSRINQTHPLVIVGWKLSSFGQLWLVRSIDGGTSDIPVAFGQFSVDEQCIAPVNNFDNTAWQDATRAFDVLFGDKGDEWYSWPHCQLDLTVNDLPSLSKALGCGFAQAVIEKRCFTLRDKERIARSRSACLTDVTWSEERNAWEVRIAFNE